MPEDNGTVDAEDNKRFFEKVGLLAGTPSRTVRPVTISKTPGSVVSLFYQADLSATFSFFSIGLKIPETE